MDESAGKIATEYPVLVLEMATRSPPKLLSRRYLLTSPLKRRKPPRPPEAAVLGRSKHTERARGLEQSGPFRFYCSTTGFEDGRVETQAPKPNSANKMTGTAIVTSSEPSRNRPTKMTMPKTRSNPTLGAYSQQGSAVAAKKGAYLRHSETIEVKPGNSSAHSWTER